MNYNSSVADRHSGSVYDDRSDPGGFELPCPLIHEPVPVDKLLQRFSRRVDRHIVQAAHVLQSEADQVTDGVNSFRDGK